jgi:hypothetical protein
MQYKHIVDLRREEIAQEKHNLPTMMHNVQDDFWDLHYPDGKIVRSFLDNRKKDLVLQEASF